MTTTHDPALGGAPRLIVCLAGDGTADVGGLEHQQVFVLQDPITRLGTADDADVKLDWTDHALGEIQHDEFDEYVYVQKSGDVPVRVDGQAVTRHPLRTGDRLEAGPWTLMYFREEYADHGLPYGGHQGGEGSPQRAQPPRSETTPARVPGPDDLRTDLARGT